MGACDIWRLSALPEMQQPTTWLQTWREKQYETNQMFTHCGETGQTENHQHHFSKRTVESHHTMTDWNSRRGFSHSCYLQLGITKADAVLVKTHAHAHTRSHTQSLMYYCLQMGSCLKCSQSQSFEFSESSQFPGSDAFANIIHFSFDGNIS